MQNSPKKIIDVFEYASDIMKAVNGGVLLTSKNKDTGKVNSMTISWGMLGIEWAKPIFITFVREHRYTREFLENSDEFTISIPYGEVNKKILGYCGTKSGRTTDKINDLGLTLEQPLSISVPGIKELPLTLECKVIYKQKQDPTAVSPANQSYYPQDVDSFDTGSNKDYHVAYYGEIVNAYIIEK